VRARSIGPDIRDAILDAPTFRPVAGVELDKSRGVYVDPSKTRMTADSWMATWLATRTDLRATTRSRVVGIISDYISPRLGRIPLGELNRLRVQEWASALPGSPESVRKVVNVLSGALQLAVEDGRLPANPAQRLKLPKKVRHSKRYLSHDQVAALAIEVGSPSEGSRYGYDTAVLTLAYCGLRWGELPGLRIGDVDLDRRRLEIRQTVVADKGYQRIEAPKDYEHRSIPIPAFLATLLARQIEGRSPEQPVFYGIRTGSWLRNHVFRVGWFDPAATAVGLGGLTPHEMRHTAASLAVSAGANVKVVQRDARPRLRGGHARRLRRSLRRGSRHRCRRARQDGHANGCCHMSVGDEPVSIWKIVFIAGIVAAAAGLNFPRQRRNHPTAARLECKGDIFSPAG
jgi:integrase